MAASQGSREDPAGRAQAASDETCSPPEPQTDPTLLQKVLQETLLTTGLDEPLHAAAQAALREVAARHANEALSLDPIAVELVRAILRCEYPRWAEQSATREATSTQVAQTLMDDPVARPRLEALWNRLRRGES